MPSAKHQIVIPVKSQGLKSLTGDCTGRFLLAGRRHEYEVVPLVRGARTLHLSCVAAAIVPLSSSSESVIISLVENSAREGCYNLYAYCLHKSGWRGRQIAVTPFTSVAVASIRLDSSTAIVSQLPVTSDPVLLASFSLLTVLVNGYAAVFNVELTTDGDITLSFAWQTVDAVAPLQSPAIVTQRYLVTAVGSDVLISYIGPNDPSVAETKRHRLDNDAVRQLISLSNNKILVLTSTGSLFVLGLSMPFKDTPAIVQLLPPASRAQVENIAAFPTFLDPFVPSSGCFAGLGYSDGTVLLAPLSDALDVVSKFTTTKGEKSAQHSVTKGYAKVALVADQAVATGGDCASIAMVPPQSIFVHSEFLSHITLFVLEPPQG
ncbi:hypothetical protein DIPPA_09605 [Diplonema papillatum]|nr:hypothetical protein DIPPA_09605 [Diplonema papillatum]